MKKLIIMALSVAMGIAANAATCKWSFSALNYSDAQASVSGYTAYLIDNTWAKYSDGLAAAEAVAASGTAAAGVIQSSGLAEGTGSQAGTIKLAMTTATALLKEPGSGYGVGDKIDVMTVVLDNKGNYVSFTKSVTFNNSIMISATHGNQSEAEWKAIPEPTSAMLMLLGMAGLALRRRRA